MDQYHLDFSEDGQVCLRKNDQVIFRDKCEEVKFNFQHLNEPDMIDKLVLSIASNAQYKRRTVKRCKNCGRYFIADKRQQYCDRLVEMGLTCSDVGPRRTFLQKLNEDEALKVYTRAYKTHYARMLKEKMTQEDFEVWCIRARINLDTVRAGEMDLQEFKKWLKK